MPTDISKLLQHAKYIKSIADYNPCQEDGVRSFRKRQIDLGSEKTYDPDEITGDYESFRRIYNQNQTTAANLKTALGHEKFLYTEALRGLTKKKPEQLKQILKLVKETKEKLATITTQDARNKQKKQMSVQQDIAKIFNDILGYDKETKEKDKALYLFFISMFESPGEKNSQQAINRYLNPSNDAKEKSSSDSRGNNDDTLLKQELFYLIRIEELLGSIEKIFANINDFMLEGIDEEEKDKQVKLLFDKLVEKYILRNSAQPNEIPEEQEQQQEKNINKFFKASNGDFTEVLIDLLAIQEGSSPPAFISYNGAIIFGLKPDQIKILVELDEKMANNLDVNLDIALGVGEGKTFLGSIITKIYGQQNNGSDRNGAIIVDGRVVGYCLNKADKFKKLIGLDKTDSQKAETTIKSQPIARSGGGLFGIMRRPPARTPIVETTVTTKESDKTEIDPADQTESDTTDTIVRSLSLADVVDMTTTSELRKKIQEIKKECEGKKNKLIIFDEFPHIDYKLRKYIRSKLSSNDGYKLVFISATPNLELRNTLFETENLEENRKKISYELQIGSCSFTEKLTEEELTENIKDQSVGQLLPILFRVLHGKKERYYITYYTNGTPPQKEVTDVTGYLSDSIEDQEFKNCYKNIGVGKIKKPTVPIPNKLEKFLQEQHTPLSSTQSLEQDRKDFCQQIRDDRQSNIEFQQVGEKHANNMAEYLITVATTNNNIKGNIQFIMPDITSVEAVSLVRSKFISKMPNMKVKYIAYRDPDTRKLLVIDSKNNHVIFDTEEDLKKRIQEEKVLMLYSSSDSIGGDYGFLSRNVALQAIHTYKEPSISEMQQWVARHRKSNFRSLNTKKIVIATPAINREALVSRMKVKEKEHEQLDLMNELRNRICKELGVDGDGYKHLRKLIISLIRNADGVQNIGLQIIQDKDILGELGSNQLSRIQKIINNSELNDSLINNCQRYQDTVKRLSFFRSRGNDSRLVSSGSKINQIEMKIIRLSENLRVLESKRRFLNGSLDLFNKEAVITNDNKKIYALVSQMSSEIEKVKQWMNDMQGLELDKNALISHLHVIYQAIDSCNFVENINLDLQFSNEDGAKVKEYNQFKKEIFAAKEEIEKSLSKFHGQYININYKRSAKISKGFSLDQKTIKSEIINIIEDYVQFLKYSSFRENRFANNFININIENFVNKYLFDIDDKLKKQCVKVILQYFNNQEDTRSVLSVTIKNKYQLSYSEVKELAENISNECFDVFKSLKRPEEGRLPEEQPHLNQGKGGETKKRGFLGRIFGTKTGVPVANESDTGKRLRELLTDVQFTTETRKGDELKSSLQELEAQTKVAEKEIAKVEKASQAKLQEMVNQKKILKMQLDHKQAILVQQNKTLKTLNEASSRTEQQEAELSQLKSTTDSISEEIEKTKKQLDDKTREITKVVETITSTKPPEKETRGTAHPAASMVEDLVEVETPEEIKIVASKERTLIAIEEQKLKEQSAIERQKLETDANEEIQKIIKELNDPENTLEIRELLEKQIVEVKEILQTQLRAKQEETNLQAEILALRKENVERIEQIVETAEQKIAATASMPVIGKMIPTIEEIKQEEEQEKAKLQLQIEQEGQQLEKILKTTESEKVEQTKILEDAQKKLEQKIQESKEKATTKPGLPPNSHKKSEAVREEIFAIEQEAEQKIQEINEEAKKEKEETINNQGKSTSSQSIDIEIKRIEETKNNKITAIEKKKQIKIEAKQAELEAIEKIEKTKEQAAQKIKEIQEKLKETIEQESTTEEQESTTEEIQIALLEQMAAIKVLASIELEEQEAEIKVAEKVAEIQENAFIQIETIEEQPRTDLETDSESPIEERKKQILNATEEKIETAKNEFERKLQVTKLEKEEQTRIAEDAQKKLETKIKEKKEKAQRKSIDPAPNSHETPEEVLKEIEQIKQEAEQDIQKIETNASMQIQQTTSTEEAQRINLEKKNKIKEIEEKKEIKIEAKKVELEATREIQKLKQQAKIKIEEFQETVKKTSEQEASTTQGNTEEIQIARLEEIAAIKALVSIESQKKEAATKAAEKKQRLKEESAQRIQKVERQAIEANQQKMLQQIKAETKRETIVEQQKTQDQIEAKTTMLKKIQQSLKARANQSKDEYRRKLQAEIIKSKEKTSEKLKEAAQESDQKPNESSTSEKEPKERAITQQEQKNRKKQQEEKAKLEKERENARKKIEYEEEENFKLVAKDLQREKALLEKAQKEKAQKEKAQKEAEARIIEEKIKKIEAEAKKMEAKTKEREDRESIERKKQQENEENKIKKMEEQQKKAREAEAKKAEEEIRKKQKQEQQERENTIKKETKKMSSQERKAREEKSKLEEKRIRQEQEEQRKAREAERQQKEEELKQTQEEQRKAREEKSKLEEERIRQEQEEQRKAREAETQQKEEELRKAREAETQQKEEELRKAIEEKIKPEEKKPEERNLITPTPTSRISHFNQPSLFGQEKIKLFDDKNNIARFFSLWSKSKDLQAPQKQQFRKSVTVQTTQKINEQKDVARLFNIEGNNFNFYKQVLSAGDPNSKEELFECLRDLDQDLYAIKQITAKNSNSFDKQNLEQKNLIREQIIKNVAKMEQLATKIHNENLLKIIKEFKQINQVGSAAPTTYKRFHELRSHVINLLSYSNLALDQVEYDATNNSLRYIDQQQQVLLEAQTKEERLQISSELEPKTANDLVWVEWIKLAAKVAQNTGDHNFIITGCSECPEVGLKLYILGKKYLLSPNFDEVTQQAIDALLAVPESSQPNGIELLIKEYQKYQTSPPTSPMLLMPTKPR